MKVVHDLFPAFIAVAPEGTYEKVQMMTSSPISEGAYGVTKTRVVVSDTRIIVAVDHNDGPRIIFSEAYTEFHKSNDRNEDSYVITENGKMIAYKYDANCGCGSRLRSWNPYRHVYSEKDPQE